MAKFINNLSKMLVLFVVVLNSCCLFADDGALSWSEFNAFFTDGILSTEDLQKLFNDIDTHNTK